MKKIINLLILGSALAVSMEAKAQVDPHFSQYYAYPLWLNPALAGAIDGDYRVSANYRSQWNNISNPFSTIGVSADFVTPKNLNIGVNVLNQKAGDAGYNYLNAYASVAYTGIKFGAQGYQRLVIGLQGGVLSRRFDPAKFQFGDQWNPITGYNPSNMSGEALSRNSSNVFDAGAGILYFDGDPNKTLNPFIGVSAFHLTQPDDPFVFGRKEKLPIRYAVHGGLRFTLSDQISITPNALFMRQNNSDEKMIGAYAQIKANTFTDFLIGGNYRFDDAATPFIGFHYQNMVIGFSYDTNTSRLGNLARSSNAFEISLSFIGRKTRAFPDMNFICPRL